MLVVHIPDVYKRQIISLLMNTPSWRKHIFGYVNFQNIIVVLLL